MKLSVIFTFGIVLAFSDMAKADCTEYVDSAQGCVKQCGIDATPDGMNNLLNYCVGNRNTTAGNLTSCCQMNDFCTATVENATECLNTEFANVGEAAEAYFTCTLTPLTCPFGQFCVNLFAGGYDTNSSNNFSVLARQAESCEDTQLASFGYDACNVLGTCCEACKPQIADLVNAVLDDILLTTYGQPGVASCGAGKTCDDYNATAPGRKLYGMGDLDGPTNIIVDYEGVAKDLAQDCNSGLTDDVILYNESYAVNNYFDCLYKKTGKAAAVLDDAEQAASSGISTMSFGPATVLSAAMASVVCAIVA